MGHRAWGLRVPGLWVWGLRIGTDKIGKRAYVCMCLYTKVLHTV